MTAAPDVTALDAARATLADLERRYQEAGAAAASALALARTPETTSEARRAALEDYGRAVVAYGRLEPDLRAARRVVRTLEARGRA